MSDLIDWTFQWMFSVYGLAHMIGVGILAGAAIWVSPGRRFWRLCIVAAGLWIAIAVPLSLINPSSLRATLAGVLWVLSIVAFYTVFLAVLVAKGKKPRAVLVTSALLFVLQAPLSLLSGLYLTCYVGHDCP